MEALWSGSLLDGVGKNDSRLFLQARGPSQLKKAE